MQVVMPVSFLFSVVPMAIFYPLTLASEEVSQLPKDIIDGNGYVIYCPCMGRFGNRADYFLGALAFAKHLNRTLVLPPWPTMKGHIEFDEWFNSSEINAYHRVVVSRDFMHLIAPAIWPPDKRTGFCYQPRYRNSQSQCRMKEGSPSEPFWNYVGVEFADYHTYHLSYYPEDAANWRTLYDPMKYPVLALKGAPASFPVKQEYVQLHRYLIWTNDMVEEAMSHARKHFSDERYIAVHLRNGVDWERACENAIGTTNYMSSPQCLGYNNVKSIQHSLCLQSQEEVTRTVRRAVEDQKITKIYVLTDKNPMKHEIETSLADLHVTVVHDDPDLPQYDIIVASRADLFIGNCVSSFTAFIKRERDWVTNKPTIFFGM